VAAEHCQYRARNRTVAGTHEYPGELKVLLGRCADILDGTANPDSVIVVVIRPDLEVEQVLLRPEVGAFALVIEAHGTITQEVSWSNVLSEFIATTQTHRSLTNGIQRAVDLTICVSDKSKRRGKSIRTGSCLWLTPMR
jgi:hypothetical protein